jgi:hypothetical protein
MKECIKCKRHKTIDSFNKKKNGKFGVRTECRVCTKSAGSTYYKANRERILQHRKDTDELDRQRKWRQSNQHIKNFLTAEYRAKRRLASPKWLTTAQKDEMKVIYEKARELRLTVDHIVPINGKNVSGLHVPWNLQLITLQENVKKSNKF